MPIRGSPDGAHHPRPQAGRDHPESVVAINRNGWSQSIGIAGRDRPVRAVESVHASIADLATDITIQREVPKSAVSRCSKMSNGKAKVIGAPNLMLP